MVNTLHMGSFDFAMALIFEQIQNINADFHDQKSDFHVNVEFFCGDTLASQAVGGFIEYTGNAHFLCRECLIEKKDIGSFF